MGKDYGRGGPRPPHPNGRKPSAPPPRSGRSTFDGCAVVAFGGLALAGLVAVGGPIAAWAAFF